jgi:hypothetical protein
MSSDKELVKNKTLRRQKNIEVFKLLNSYKTIECEMSLKIRVLDSHLDFLPKYLDTVSDEHDERFRQSSMEKRYQDKWISSLPFFKINIYIK